ncbi:MAG: class I SAM-dependent methyltransferase [Gammaproteobacteria bacterium]|nr:class I SAM-dependent methyltransferase [Gammaproteobacteria bacterium]
MTKNDTIASYDNQELVQAYINKDKVNDHLELEVSLNGLNIKDKKLLDIGCGYGRDVNIFRKMGAIAEGVDGSSEMIKAARSMYGDYFRVIALNDLAKISDQYYDLIYCRNLLVHVPSEEVDDFFKNVKRILKTKGRFIIITKEGQGFSISTTMGKESPRKTLLHSKEKIASQLQALGMTIVGPPCTLKKKSTGGDPMFYIHAEK